jgi:hypothetical protein
MLGRNVRGGYHDVYYILTGRDQPWTVRKELSKKSMAEREDARYVRKTLRDQSMPLDQYEA